MAQNYSTTKVTGSQSSETKFFKVFDKELNFTVSMPAGRAVTWLLTLDNYELSALSLERVFCVGVKYE